MCTNCIWEQRLFLLARQRMCVCFVEDVSQTFRLLTEAQYRLLLLLGNLSTKLIFPLIGHHLRSIILWDRNHGFGTETVYCVGWAFIFASAEYCIIWTMFRYKIRFWLNVMKSIACVSSWGGILEWRYKLQIPGQFYIYIYILITYKMRKIGEADT